MTIDMYLPDTYTCVDCEALQEFIEWHFVVEPVPSEGCLSVADLHDLLLPRSGKPCPRGCGLTVPLVDKSYSGFVWGWLALHGHVDVAEARVTPHSNTGWLYTNLKAKDCMTPLEEPLCKHCGELLPPRRRMTKSLWFDKLVHAQ